MRLVPAAFLVLALASGILLCGSPALAQETALYGTVFKTKRGGAPLRLARVQLLTPGTNVVKHSSYTDSRGKYALRRITPGEFDVRVRIGRRVLKQIVKGRAGVRERRKIRLTAKPARLVIVIRTD